MIQKNRRVDSIVSIFNFTEPAQRLLQQNRPLAVLRLMSGSGPGCVKTHTSATRPGAEADELNALCGLVRSDLWTPVLSGLDICRVLRHG